MTYLGNRAVGSTVYVPFTTHDKDGGAVAPSSALEAADVRIYKDGSATQRSSANGITMTSPFDSVVGLHMLAIDLSDDTDSGFYAAGSHYDVILVPDETVDSETVVSVIASFDIGVPADLTAAINAQVLDVLNTDTFAEPSGVPGATVSLVTKIGYLYMALRNKVTVSSTKKTFFDDGDAAEWEKDLSDDGSTYTESEGNSV